MTKRKPGNRPLELADPTVRARWAWVFKDSRHAYSAHRLSRVVGPGTGDDVLANPALERIQGVACCGVDGTFVPYVERGEEGRFENVVCLRCKQIALEGVTP